MKKYFKFLFLLTAFFISLCVLPSPVVALGPPGGEDEVEDPDAPIDGGVGLLIAAGVGYGIKKIRDERKKKFDSLN